MIACIADLSAHQRKHQLITDSSRRPVRDYEESIHGGCKRGNTRGLLSRPVQLMILLFQMCAKFDNVMATLKGQCAQEKVEISAEMSKYKRRVSLNRILSLI